MAWPPAKTTPSWPQIDSAAVSRLPHVIEAQAAIDNKTHRTPTFEDANRYLREKSLGLHGDTSETDKHDHLSWEARKLSVSVSSSVVALSTRGPGYKDFHGSGIIVEFNGVQKVMTSAYILGEHIGDEAFSLMVNIYLPNQRAVTGHVVFVDQHHNIAIIDGELDGTMTTSFDTMFPDLGEAVVAVSRRRDFKLVASHGSVNIRGDHLDSDDLLSSSCNIYECGIGGPLFDMGSWKVIGMNFFSRKGFTPFMPSSILLKCMEHFLVFGKIMRPWIGLRMRDLNEVKTDALELIYRKLKTTHGIIVKEVMKGSPADLAGICVGDVIVACNEIPTTSPAQFADVLLMVEPSLRSSTYNVQRSPTSVEVGVLKEPGKNEAKRIHFESFTPAVVNRWPVLPV